MDLRAANSRIAALQGALSATMHQLEVVQASRSWRLTAVFRWLGTTLLGS